MLDLIAHNLAPIMFVTVMAMLLIGYPVAFTLAAGGLMFFAFGVEVSHLSDQIRLFWPLLQSHPDRIYGLAFYSPLIERIAVSLILTLAAFALFKRLMGGSLPEQAFKKFAPALLAVLFLMSDAMLGWTGVLFDQTGLLKAALSILVLAVLVFEMLEAKRRTDVLGFVATGLSSLFFVVVGLRIFALTFFGLSGQDWTDDLLAQIPWAHMAASLIVIGVAWYALTRFFSGLANPALAWGNV